VDADMTAMRRLDLDTAHVDDGVDMLIAPILRASRHLISLRLWGVLLEEMAALLPALAKSLRQLSLGLVADRDYDLEEATAWSRDLAGALALQITALSLGACPAPIRYAPWGAQRGHLLALASAWIAAVPAAMANGVTVALRPGRRLLVDADGVDDGAFAALVPRFEAIGVRCRLEIGAPNAVSRFADLLAD